MTDYLLVHGMCAAAWEWERVIPRLQADPRVGKVIAPDLPGRGDNQPGEYATIRLRDYFDTVRRALRDNNMSDVVLVGHSGGGTTLQAIAAAEPDRIKQVVFLCAAIPKRGQALADWAPAPLRWLYSAFLKLRNAREKGIMPGKRLARWGMCHDLPEGECDEMIERLVPEPMALIFGRIDWPAERMRAPASYILTTEDRIVNPKQQRKYAESVPGIEITTLPMGHARPVAEPDDLLRLLLQHA
jgi:pimeloyl-ACP methyl ester carboxylesterase